MKKFICALLATIACLALFACTPSNVDKAKAKMEEAGYTVLATQDEEAEGLVGAFNATKISLSGAENLTAFLFDNKDDAKKFAEKLGEKAVQDGKWVYFGSDAAIEAFTK